MNKLRNLGGNFSVQTNTNLFSGESEYRLFQNE